jgi:hypothetical protein
MITLPAEVGRGSLYASDTDLSALSAHIVGRPEAAIVGWHAVRLEADFECDVRVLGFVEGACYITSPVRPWTRSAGWFVRSPAVSARSSRTEIMTKCCQLWPATPGSQAGVARLRRRDGCVAIMSFLGTEAAGLTSRRS